MTLLNDRKKLIRTGVAAAVLAVLYVVLITLVPQLSVWSYPQRYNYSDQAQEVSVTSGKVYEQKFVMPYDRIDTAEFLISNNASNVVAIDAELELIDPAGVVIASKHVTSAYDAALKTGEKVIKGAEYTLRLTVGSVGDKGNAAPSILNNNGNSVFIITGRGTGARSRMIFALIYVIMATMILLFVYDFDKVKIGDNKISDGLFLGVLIISAVFLVCQYYDLFMIVKSALRMIDSFKAGNITDYYGASYLAELSDQSDKMLFAYEYNFFQIFFTSILILPLAFIYDGNIYGGGMDGYLAVTYLAVVMAVLLIVSWKLIGRIAKSCGMEEGYEKAIRTLFIASPMLLYMSVAYGQIDIMYIIVILLALPFYYKEQYRRFSIIMSLAVAMKTLPLMIFIPLILLANKRIRDIIINFLIVMVLPVFTHLVFERGTGHSAIAAIIKEDYSYTERITEFKIGGLSLFILAFALICIVCYMHKADTKDRKQMLFDSMLAVFAVYSAFISFVTWHQQWMIPLVMALAFLIPFISDKRIMLLDIGAELLFIVTAGVMGTSSHMANFGVLPFVANDYSDAPELSVILNNISPVTITCIRTALAAVLFYMVYMMIRNRKDMAVQAVPRTFAVGRAGILYLFIIFYCWTFFYIG